MESTNSARNQYLATFCLNLLSISYGLCCGWTSPSLPILQSTDSPLPSGPISSDEASWIGAFLCIGGFVGNIVSGWMADRFGRKLTACLAAIPQIIAWVLVLVADNVYYLMGMRFLLGFSGGVSFMIIPMFIAEIAEDRIRGLLGSTLVFSCNMGILLMYILGGSLSYANIPWIPLVFPIVFLTGFLRIPDTPFYLMRKNDYVESENSLRFYRGYRPGTQHVSSEFKMELVKLKDAFGDENQTLQDEKITWGDLISSHARKAFLIGISLMALNQFCGCFAMLNYTASIFNESGSTLSANTSAIVIGSIQMVGSYFSTMLVERAGRKLLLMVSATGIGLGLAIFAGFSYAKYVGLDVESFTWLPLVCFSFVIFIGSVGVLTLPFLVLAEVMPQKIKGFAISFCMGILWIFAFLAIKYFSTLFDVLGMHGTMLLFSVCSLGGALFVAFMVPETKGKSLEAIAKLMS
ncbi:facilitated trehalose transporter Tret1-like [Ochlerotatus camptorhynchus]|uniref:facilitated trehalose transporter Tret1-like n=1 Tax=Ochlerotatus camptorhynchus TaxID=644619 RepID=UPI0031D44798